MIKTTNLTKSLLNHQNHSQTIHLYTPSTTSSSRSGSETDSSSSFDSSYKSSTSINNDANSMLQEKSTLVLITVVEKLKHELASVKQAKKQLEALYKVSLANIDSNAYNKVLG